MAKYKWIFFDVGNTLLFPNRPRILAPLPADKHPSLGGWQALERRSKQEFDQTVLSGKVDHGFWWNFYTNLLLDLGCLDENTRDQLVQNTQQSANWDHILPGTRDSLDRIRRSYTTAVICFSSITDSGNVGHEKPHPAIFKAALQRVNADPSESLYVGDVYSIDYIGARNIGMQAVMFDVAGAYRDRDLPRVETLAQLENWLQH
jgi:FMN phosphatase YigB (HAD superfamily)